MPLSCEHNMDLFQRDYKLGLLHLAWLEAGGGNRLLFAQCELYPAEIASVNACPIQTLELPEGQKLHYVRKEYDARDLRDLYHNLGENGKIALDWLPGELLAPGLSALSRWPHLTLARQDFGARENGWPYLSLCWGDVRAHHYLYQGKTEDLPRIDFGADVWLEDRLCWSFAEFPELLGSIHLTMPNPLWRKLSVKMRPERKDGPGIDFTFSAREDIEPCEIKLRVIEEKLGGYEAYPDLDISLRAGERTKAYLELWEEPERISVSIYDSGRGLLHFEPFTGFIKEINLNIGIKTRERWIGKDGKPIFERMGSHVETSSLSGASSYSNSLFRYARARRAAKGSAKKMGEQWLDNHDEACAKVGSLLENCKSATIVDPYFSPKEFLDFVPPVCKNDAGITILTSAQGLASKPNERLEKARELQALIDGISAKRPWKFNVEILDSAPSQPPAIHDRFLLLDNGDAWHLGSSLNHLGNRASVITRLHDGQTVKEKIDAIRADSSLTLALADYIKREEGGNGAS